MKKSNTTKKYTWGEDPEMSGPRNYFRETLIVNAVTQYKNKGIILDAGCGSGNVTIRLAQNKFSLIAIDTAEKSLDFLRNKVKKLGLEKKVSVKKANLLKTPFKKNYFDAIVCGEVLEHIHFDTKVIQEFFRILRSGGICVVTVPAHPELWDISDDISGHERRYTKEEMKKKFKTAGFNVLYCNYWGFPLNNLWHTRVFLPFLDRKMKTKENITQDNSLKARLVKNDTLRKIVSYVFFTDVLFNFTQKGNALLIIGKKTA